MSHTAFRGPGTGYQKTQLISGLRQFWKMEYQDSLYKRAEAGRTDSVATADSDLSGEAARAHRDAVASQDAWRAQNKARLMKNRQAAKENKARLDEHDAMLDEHQQRHNQIEKAHKVTQAHVDVIEARHDEMQGRVEAVENGHNEIHGRVGAVEDAHKEHNTHLQQLSKQNKLIFTLVGGSAIVAGIAGVWFLLSKLRGKKRNGDSDSDGESPPGRRGRGHPRAWSVAPELRSGRHAGKYSNDMNTYFKL
jgi:hypothetical protein